MKLETIPIDCWLCQSTYHVPARLTLWPDTDPNWYSKQASANVWCSVDRSVIAAHLQAHWPILMFCYAWWQTSVLMTGIDVLAPYWSRA